MQSITNTVIGTYAPDFELPGTDKAVHHLARYLDRYKAVGIVFLSNVCPDVKRVLPQLLQLQADLAPQGFTLIGINPNDTVQASTEGMEAMQQFAQAEALTFPYIRDVTQDVVQAFGASQTPEAFVLDQAGIIRYQGRVTGEGGETPLKDAAIAILQQQPVQTAQTQPAGTNILWKR